MSVTPYRRKACRNTGCTHLKETIIKRKDTLFNVVRTERKRRCFNDEKYDERFRVDCAERITLGTRGQVEERKRRNEKNEKRMEVWDEIEKLPVEEQRELLSTCRNSLFYKGNGGL